MGSNTFLDFLSETVCGLDSKNESLYFLVESTGRNPIQTLSYPSNVPCKGLAESNNPLVTCPFMKDGILQFNSVVVVVVSFFFFVFVFFTFLPALYTCEA